MRVIILVSFSVALVGCSMFQSKEEECLRSTRLEFKDPDSLQVLQNLGRLSIMGEPPEPAEFFWLRYKAKNSFNAYESADMACEKIAGKWIRQKSMEDLRASFERMRVLEAGINKDLSMLGVNNARAEELKREMRR